jgi:membrane protein
MGSRFKQYWSVSKAAASQWSKDRAPRLGAALAYYTTFSMVPLLIVIIGIIGLVFGEETAQSAIIDQIRNLVGPQSADAIKEMLHRADQPSSGIFSTIIATVTLLVGAAGFFNQLKDALNTVWGIEPKGGRGIWGFLKENFLSFATVVGSAFLLLVSLIVSTALSAFGKWFGSFLLLPEVVLQSINILLSLLVITGLFALIFKVLPDARIAWSDVWVGAGLTAVLFTIGKFAIGLYLGKSDVGSAYGAAGSLVIVLVWVYYSVQILLYGAEFTEVYASHFGKDIQPTEDARRSKAKQPLLEAGLQQHTRAATEKTSDPVSRPRRHRRWAIAGAVVAFFVIATLVAASVLGGPVKRYAERTANERLPDYEIRIGSVDLQPFRLGLELQDVDVRLRSQADPPLAQIPHLQGRVRFWPLLTGKIDLNLEMKRPHLAATEEQVEAVLHPQNKEEVKEQAVAWQDMVRELMPIRVSLSISDGQLRYRSEPTVEPIALNQLQVHVENVTNRPVEHEMFPSALRVDARFSEESKIALDSRADLLAKPSPRVDGDLKVERLALPSLRPLIRKYNVQLRDGAVDMTAHVQYASPTTVVDVSDLRIQGAKVDYVHTAKTKQKEEQQAKKGAEKAKDAHKNPSVVVKVSLGKILHSDVGFVNTATSPDYRVFLSDLDLELQNFSNRPEEGMGTIKLNGSFMGSGPMEVKGSFRPEKPNPDFNVRVRIVKTPVERLNKVLEAYGQIHASQGTFAFFSDMTVKNNRIEGYVKPFLKDVQVYDPDEDKDQKPAKKLFEAVVNGVLDLFKSTPTDQVATKTDISGPVEAPKASTVQILEKLVENAFFKAILPGFEGQPHQAA